MAYKWWQTAVFYQIYPRSFVDKNGDGIGDLDGIIDKLDYLESLGVNGLWLSPHFPSPNWDWGYDISDFVGVAPEYGTMDEFYKFLDEVHSRGMHIILDLVLNHTSDEHAWFLESRSSRNNPKASWYIWQDPVHKPGVNGLCPPNNWQSCFDGSAWTYVPERGQYYYHYFMRQQPDLNWRNPEVKESMWQAARFWLDLGVDGFRLDAIGTIYEDPLLPPHSVPLDLAGLRSFSDTAQTADEKHLLAQYWQDMFKHQLGAPELHSLMKELRSILDEYSGDRLLVGEDDNIEYMGDGSDELHLVFNFPLMKTNQLTPVHIRTNQNERLCQLDSLPVRGWGCNTLGNHDCSRLMNRYGDGLHNEKLARLHLSLLMTLRGTPFLYYGEEIGMSDLVIEDASKLCDTMATWYYNSMLNDIKVEPMDAARRAGAMSRDKNRTPMQWRNDSNAGFCPKCTEPWLSVNPNFVDGINVEEQEKDLSTLLHFYRQMIRIRQENPALVVGEYLPLHESAETYLAFLRSSADQNILVVLNFVDKIIEVDFSDLQTDVERVVYPSHLQGNLSLHAMELEPYGIFIAILP